MLCCQIFSSKIFFYILITLLHTHKLQQTYLVGVLSIETQNKELLPKHHTYINATYLKWLEQSNLKWVQISENDSEDIVKQKLEYVDAMLLPGGSANFYNKKGQPTKYKKIYELIFNYANQQNENGKIFPVIGTCLGFEYMLQNLTQETLELKKAVNKNSSEVIYLLPNFKNSFLTKIFTFEELADFSSIPAFHFAHKEGYYMDDVKNSEIFNREFEALGYYLTELHEKALGIFQHKKYPYIGWQFHPEKVQFEHRESLNLNKCEESLDFNERFSHVFHALLNGVEPKNTSYENIMNTRKGLYIIEQFSTMDEAYVFKPDLI